jgi:hypothetical protein
MYLLLLFLGIFSNNLILHHLARFWDFVHRAMDESSIYVQDIGCYVFWYCQSLITESGLSFNALHKNKNFRENRLK